MNHRILLTTCVAFLGSVASAQDIGSSGTTTSGSTTGGTSSGGGTVNTSGMSGGGFGGGLSSGGGGTGTGDSFLGTAPGSSFLTSGYEPGTLGHAGRAGAATATNTGSPFSRFYVNAYALGLTTTNNTRPTAFGTPLYSALYPGTQVTATTASGIGAGGRGGATGAGGVGGISGVGGVGGVSPGITGAIGTGRTGVGGSITGGMGGTGLGSTGGFRPPAHYQTAIAFKYNVPTPSQRQVELQGVLARSSDLGTKKILVDVDGGIVTLRGVVSAPEERRLAENLLRLTPGVRLVRNEIAVAP